MSKLIVLLPIVDSYRQIMAKIWPKLKFRENDELFLSPYELLAEAVKVPFNFSIVDAYLNVDPGLLKGQYMLATAISTRVDANGAFIQPEPLNLSKGEKKAITTGINEFMELYGQRWMDIGKDTWMVRSKEGKLHALPPIEYCLGKNLDEFLKKNVECAKDITEVQMWLQDTMVNYNRKNDAKPVINMLWPWGRGVAIKPSEAIQNILLLGYAPFHEGLAARLKCEHLSMTEYIRNPVSLKAYDKVICDLGVYFEYYAPNELFQAVLEQFQEGYKKKSIEEIEFITTQESALVKRSKWWPFGG